MLENLFSPFVINGKTIKNRCVVPAMVTNFCERDGKATERYIAYHEAKAKGGFGLIITEDYAVDPRGKAFSNIAGLWSDEQIEGHSKLPERVHQYGAIILAQIYHCGRQTREAVTGSMPYAPTSIPCPFSPDMPIELSVKEITELVEKFGDCALRAKQCGFDGVEIHGAHGYLIAQFMSLYSNKRVDRYGGDFINRLRFPVEIIKNVRKKCGGEFIIGFRISADEFIDGGRTLEDTKAIVPVLEKAGINLVHVSAGVNASTDTIIPPSYVEHAWIADFAKEVKTVCSIPVITVGRINDPVIADSLIKSGKADFVAMGRASLADPGIPNKAKEGNFDEIRYCIACNAGCHQSLFNDYPIRCALNPTLGKEYERSGKKAAKSKRIAVIGAGPAGLQAAITAAEAGHRVKVYEKANCAGGQYRIAAIPPCKGEITSFIRWQEVQLNRLGVEIEYNIEVTVDFMREHSANIIIVATGAQPVIPEIKGINQPHVVSAVDMLVGKADTGKNIVIIGGGQVGAEVAHHLAVQLRNITIVEMLPEIAAEEPFTARTHLLRALEKWKVNVLTNTYVTEITKNTVKVKGAAEMEVPADTVVIAAGARPDNQLANELSHAGWKVRIIGDAGKISRVIDGITQGYDLGRNL